MTAVDVERSLRIATLGVAWDICQFELQRNAGTTALVKTATHIRDRSGYSVSVDRGAPSARFEFCVGSESKRTCSICVATAVQKSNRLRERARRAFACSSRAILHAAASPCRSRRNAMTADTLMRRDIESTSIKARSHPLSPSARNRTRFSR